MTERNQTKTPALPRRRRRRRRDFLDALQQSQVAGTVPVINVGQRLRELRAEKGFSIRDLAKISGLNVNTLSMIENGKNSPSLETLQQLSISLETPIVSFFEDKIPSNQYVHHKASQRPRMNFAHGVLEDLGTGMPRKGAESFLVTLQPHSNSGDHDIVHTGRETVYCLEGRLTYNIENQAFVLEAGDSLIFEAHLPHRWQNTDALPTRMLLVLCPSDEQDHPTERHFTPDTAHPKAR